MNLRLIHKALVYYRHELEQTKHMCMIHNISLDDFVKRHKKTIDELINEIKYNELIALKESENETTQR